LNIIALIAIFIFAVVLLSIFGSLYIGAFRSYKRGEMDYEGIKLLRWGLLGYIVLYIILATTALLVG
jgi:hypothetical protein